MVRPDYVVVIKDRSVRFQIGERYYIQYLSRKAPKATRTFIGAVFEEFSEGKLHFTTPYGNPVEIEPEMIINAL